MLIWLGELIIASWALSYGAEHLSVKYGAKFIGRTVLSIATTLPEIAIVAYAAAAGNYGVAIGAGLGSNLLMMTLGLSIMLIIATTRLSKAPLRGLDVSSFRLDKLFLFITAIVSAVLFVDGYNYFDGFIFIGMFVAYFIMALREMKVDKNKELLSSMPKDNNEVTRQNKNEYKNNYKDHQISEATTTTTSTASKSEPDLINSTEDFQNVPKAHN
ncbi:MAG TPA: hypothetical protein VE593_09295, partial [Nitrososphaeraceae archaeon]|nr:hypothetical protein [Nitrososphaeraceae archaeon]